MSCGALPSGIPSLGGYNFSFYRIVTTITIRLYQQMVVFNCLTIDDGKELRIDGELAMID